MRNRSGAGMFQLLWFFAMIYNSLGVHKIMFLMIGFLQKGVYLVIIINNNKNNHIKHCQYNNVSCCLTWDTVANLVTTYDVAEAAMHNCQDKNLLSIVCDHCLPEAMLASALRTNVYIKITRSMGDTGDSSRCELRNYSSARCAPRSMMCVKIVI